VKTGTDWLRKTSGKVAEAHVLPVSGNRASAIEVEEWLQGHGVSYAPAALIPMDLINEKDSRGNQARKDPLVADSVERFTASARAGADFPPIVVFQRGGKLVIVDGNNRHEAHKKARRSEILGIVISADTPSELIQLLTVEANARHGVTPELSWRIQQAFGLVALGFTDQQASDASAISPAQLKAARAVREAEARARQMKITRFSDLAAGIKQKLAGLRDDSVFYAAAHEACRSNMTLADVTDMMRDIKAGRSEAERLQAISEISDNRAIEAATKKVMGRTKSVSSAKHSLVTGIGKILAVDPVTLQRQVLTKTDKDLLVNRVQSLVKKLTELDAALAQLNLPDEDE